MVYHQLPVGVVVLIGNVLTDSNTIREVLLFPTLKPDALVLKGEEPLKDEN